VVRTSALTAALDEVLRGLDPDDFLVALPALRLAFTFFPPSEKAALARAVLVLHGRDPAEARSLLRARVEPAVTAAGAALDEAVERVLIRYGLAPGEVKGDA